MAKTKVSRSNTLKKGSCAEQYTSQKQLAPQCLTASAGADIQQLEETWQAFARRSQTPEAAKDLVGTLREYTNLLESIQTAHDDTAKECDSFLASVKSDAETPPAPISTEAPQTYSAENIESMFVELQNVHNQTIAEMDTTPAHRTGGTAPAGSTHLHKLFQLHKQSAALHTELMRAMSQEFRVEHA